MPTVHSILNELRRKRNIIETQLQTILDNQINEIQEKYPVLQNTNANIDDNEALRILLEIDSFATFKRDVGSLLESTECCTTIAEKVIQVRTLIEQGNFVAAHTGLFELHAVKQGFISSTNYGDDFVQLHFGLLTQLAQEFATKILNEYARNLNDEPSRGLIIASIEKLLLTAISKRFESLPCSSTNDGWLKTALADTTKLIDSDLTFARSILGPLFPEAMNVYDIYLKQYFVMFTEKLKLLSEADLRDPDVHVLITWGHQTVDRFFTTAQSPVSQTLFEATLNKLYSTFVGIVKEKLFGFLQKVYDFEQKALNVDEQLPITYANNEEYYSSQLPVDLYGIFNEIDNCFNGAPPHVIANGIGSLIDQFSTFTVRLMNDVKKSKERYLINRNIFKCYTATTIQLANDLYTSYTYVISFTEKYQTYHALKKNLETFSKGWKTAIVETLSILYEEYSVDVQRAFKNLLNSDSCLEICTTLEDYYKDWKYLRSTLEQTLLKHTLFKLAGTYIMAFKDSTMICKTSVERENTARNLEDNIKKFEEFFGDRNDVVFRLLFSLQNVIAQSKEALTTQGIDMFVQQYPGIPVDIFLNTLIFRGDFTSQEANEMATQVERALSAATEDEELKNFYEFYRNGCSSWYEFQ